MFSQKQPQSKRKKEKKLKQTKQKIHMYKVIHTEIIRHASCVNTYTTNVHKIQQPSTIKQYTKG
jgi:hypothetical protein